MMEAQKALSKKLQLVTACKCLPPYFAKLLCLSIQRPVQSCAGTLLLVSLVLLIPWNTGGLWARPGEEEQQEPLLQAWEDDRAAGPLPELLLASEDAEKTGEVGPAEADFWRGCLVHHSISDTCTCRVTILILGWFECTGKR